MQPMIAKEQHQEPTPDELLAMVGHELRGSLTGVLGILELAVESGPLLDPGELPEMLVIAHREAKRMAGILENLLTRSRLAEGKLSLELVPVALSEVVHNTLELFPEVAKRAVVAVPSGLAAVGDPNAVSQIVQNLIQNIDRYAVGGEVAIRAVRKSDRVMLTVADEGPGMAEPGNTTPKLGMGIGLGLAMRLAERMEGSLAAVEPLLSGATFELDLPAADAEPMESNLIEQHAIALTPRTRLLADLSEALTDRNLDRTMIGIGELARSILGSSAVSMAVQTGTGLALFGPAAIARSELPNTRLPDLSGPARLAPFPQGWEWLGRLGTDRAYFLPLTTAEGHQACLIVGFEPGVKPDDRVAARILTDIGRIVVVAVDRSELQAEADRQRKLRSSVIESLPLAISVFEGDPPRLIDMNRREREMLGIAGDSVRATDLGTSQHQFEVCFADDTPLTVDNAPVTEAVRTGRTQGPFFLKFTRLDGTTVLTRTHCAPFFDVNGAVAGAVVTSEVIDQDD